jgi:hypothetical protein
LIRILEFQFGEEQLAVRRVGAGSAFSPASVSVVSLGGLLGGSAWERWWREGLVLSRLEAASLALLIRIHSRAPSSRLLAKVSK